jgi:broad specificity phosphatase PhoE
MPARHEMSDWIVVMRHGERADHGVNAVAEANPKLTEHGTQALPTYANELIAKLQEAGMDLSLTEVEFIISPFKRCMETAAGVITQFLSKIRPKSCQIFVDPALGEVYGPIRIKEAGANHVDVVETLRAGCEEAFQREHAIGFPAPLQVRRSIATIPQWGESLEQARTRFKRAIMGAKDKLCIYITHGDALSDMMHKCHPERILFRVDFGGFIVFQGLSAEDRFHDVAKSGVDWVEDSEADAHAISPHSLLPASDPQSTEAYVTNQLPTLVGQAINKLSRASVFGFSSLSVLSETAARKANCLTRLAQDCLKHPLTKVEAHLAMMKLIVALSLPRDATSYTWFKWHAPFGATQSAKAFFQGLQTDVRMKQQVLHAAKEAGYLGALETQQDFANMATQMRTRLSAVRHAAPHLLTPKGDAVM